MAQLGEAVNASEFVKLKDEHDEKTCPWHEESHSTANPMDETEGDDDAPMTKNLGGKLKQHMLKAGDNPPSTNKVKVSFKTVKNLPYRVTEQNKMKKRLQPIFEDSDPKEYDLKYAPHHLVPGNESLKNSPLVVFLGDDKVIKNFNDEGLVSKIVNEKSIGYDVNCAENGVWLPSPYAISMGSNLWGSEEGLIALEESEYGTDAVNMVLNFRASYVAESIKESGDRQFHMRHVNYSDLVGEILEKIASKVRALAAGGCPIIGEKTINGKFEPPKGLVGRLNALSREMKTLLTGPVWRPPVFADGNTEDYATQLDKATSLPRVDKII